MGRQQRTEIAFHTHHIEKCSPAEGQGQAIENQQLAMTHASHDVHQQAAQRNQGQ